MKIKQIENIDPVLLQVTRDGELDDSYYDAIWAQKRQEAMRMVGRRLIEQVRDVPNLMVDGLWLVIDHFDRHD